MIYFKDNQDGSKLYAISEEDFANNARSLIPETCIEITSEEAESILLSQQPQVDPKELIAAQIDFIERKSLMNRAMREMMLLLAEERGSLMGLTPEQLYAANPGYRAVKDIDNQIIALRSQL